MSLQLLDSSGQVDPVRAKQAGFLGAVRYASVYANNPKNLTPAEAHLYLSNGFDVVLVFEQNTNDALGGYVAGHANGLLCASWAMTCGAPKRACLYAAVDFDSSTQTNIVSLYLKGFADAVHSIGFRAGAYGGKATMYAAALAGNIDLLWQTEAWSYGLVVPHIALLQRAVGSSVGGVPIDIDVIMGTDYGGWLHPSAQPAPLPPPPPQPSTVVHLDIQEETVADRIIVPVPCLNGQGAVVLDGGTNSEKGVTSRTPAVASNKVLSVVAWGSDPAVDHTYLAHHALWQDRDGHPLITVVNGPVTGQANVAVTVGA